jgi:hypothetical protein
MDTLIVVDKGTLQVRVVCLIRSAMQCDAIHDAPKSVHEPPFKLLCNVTLQCNINLTITLQCNTAGVSAGAR